MAYTFLAGTPGSVVSSGNITANYPAGIQSGDILVAFVALRSNVGCTHATWTKVHESLTGDIDTTAGVASAQVWWFRYAGSGTSVTFSRTGGDRGQAVVIAVRGCLASGDVVDAQAITTATVTAGGTLTWSNVTATANDDPRALLCFASYGDNSTGGDLTATTPSGGTWTEVALANDNTGADGGASVYYHSVGLAASATTSTLQATASASGTHVISTVALKPAAILQHDLSRSDVTAVSDSGTAVCDPLHSAPSVDVAALNDSGTVLCDPVPLAPTADLAALSDSGTAIPQASAPVEISPTTYETLDRTTLADSYSGTLHFYGVVGITDSGTVATEDVEPPEALDLPTRTDTATLSDSGTVLCDPLETTGLDAATLTDSATVAIAAIGVSGSDFAALSDSSTVVCDPLQISGSDTTTGSDTGTAVTDPLQITGTDTATVADRGAATTGEIVVTALDSGAVSDAVTAQWLGTLDLTGADALTGQDGALAEWLGTLDLAVADTVAVSATALLAADLTATGTDTAALSDTASVVCTPVEGSGTDLAVLDDAASVVCTPTFSTGTDTATLADAYTGRLWSYGVIGILDTGTAVLVDAETIGLSLADLTALSDSGTVVCTPHEQSGTDAATVTDLLTVTFPGSVDLSRTDTAALSEALAVTFPGSVDVSRPDTATISDVLAVTFPGTVEVAQTDTAALSDALVATFPGTLDLTGTDTVATAETVTALWAGTLDLSVVGDTLSGQDGGTSLLLPLEVRGTDTVGAADAPTTQTLEVSVVALTRIDTVGLSDLAALLLFPHETTVTDGAALADAGALSLTLERSATTAAALSDGGRVEVTPLLLEGSDRVTGADAGQAEVGQQALVGADLTALTDAITATFSGTLDLSVSDLAALSEDASTITAGTLDLSVSDTATGLDTGAAAVALIAVSASETAALSDAATLVLSPALTSGLDGASVGDGYSGLLRFYGRVGISDAAWVTFGGGVDLTATTGCALGDAGTVVCDPVPLTGTETAVLSDAGTITLPFSGDLWAADLVGISDASALARDPEEAVRSDRAVLSDVGTVEVRDPFISVSGSDQIAASDFVTLDVFGWGTIAVSDAGTVTLALVAAVGFTVSDTVAVTDGGTLSQIDLRVTDHIGVSDARRTTPAASFGVNTSSEHIRTDTTNPWTVSFTPTAQAKGILVAAINTSTATNQISSLTYGGRPLTRVASAVDTATEPTNTGWYFLGQNLPTGTQDVVVTFASATDDDYYLVVISLTSDGDLEVLTTGALSENRTSPQVSLAYQGRQALAFCAIGSGLASTASLALLAGMTAVQDNVSVSPARTGQCQRVDRQTTPSTSDFLIGYTSGTDDVSFAAVAIAETALGRVEDQALLADSAAVDTTLLVATPTGTDDTTLADSATTSLILLRQDVSGTDASALSDWGAITVSLVLQQVAGTVAAALRDRGAVTLTSAWQEATGADDATLTDTGTVLLPEVPLDGTDTATILDSGTVLTEVTPELTVSSADAAALSDAATAEWLGTLDLLVRDALTGADLSATPDLPGSWDVVGSDTAALSDTGTVSTDLFLAEADTAALSDAVTAEWVGTLDLAVSDIAGLTDTATGVADHESLTPPTDEASVSDTGTVSLDPREATGADEAVLSDAATVTVGLAVIDVSGTDTVTGADTATAVADPLEATAADTVSLSDTATAELREVLVAATDWTGLLDRGAVLLTPILVETTAEATLADSAALTLDDVLIVGGTDEVSLADASLVSRDPEDVAATDDAALSDQASVAFRSALEVEATGTDDVGLSDAVTLEISPALAVADNVDLSDVGRVELDLIEIVGTDTVAAQATGHLSSVAFYGIDFSNETLSGTGVLSEALSTSGVTNDAVSGAVVTDEQLRPV